MKVKERAREKEGKTKESEKGERLKRGSESVVMRKGREKKREREKEGNKRVSEVRVK